MKAPQQSQARQPPLYVFILLAAVGVLISIVCVYYYARMTQGNIDPKVGQQIFYLILIFFGVSVGAVLFGILGSVATLKGNYAGAKYYLQGPVALVALIVLGGFFLPRDPATGVLTLRVVNQVGLPVTNGSVILYITQHDREQPIDNTGMVVFDDVTTSELRKGFRLDISSDGYEHRVIDTTMRNPGTIGLILSPARHFVLSGTVRDAAERPLPGTVITVDGYRYHGTAITDGTFSIDIWDFKIGDNITLVSSNKDYVDKTKSFTIDRTEINKIEFILEPLNPLKSFKP